MIMRLSIRRHPGTGNIGLNPDRSRSGADAPVGEQDAEIGGISHSIAVQITQGRRPPVGEENTDVAGVDQAVVVEVPRWMRWAQRAFTRS